MEESAVPPAHPEILAQFQVVPAERPDMDPPRDQFVWHFLRWYFAPFLERFEPDFWLFLAGMS
jgi:hypothetical protein